MFNGLFPYAAAIELWQFILAAIALLMGFWRLWIAIQNGLAILAVDGKDLRRVMAETQVIAELFRLFKLGVLVGIGGASILLPPPIMDERFYGDEEMTGSLQMTITRLGLIMLTAVMLVDSFVQEWRRRQFLAYVAVEVAATLKAEEEASDAKVARAAMKSELKEEARATEEKLSAIKAD